MTLHTACEFARHHDPRIGVTMHKGAPRFYFITRNGEYVHAADGPTIRLLLADHDAA